LLKGVPWEYGDEAPKVLAKFVEMKHRLMPYLYYQAIQGHLKGHPVQRAMWLDFVEDRTTLYLDRQFMLGPSLLVAPIFVPSEEESEYYLPKGRWTSFWSDRTVEGPTWVSEKVALDDIPVWVRPGSIIVLGPAGTKRPDYDYTKGLTVKVYELEEGQTLEVNVPSGKGAEIAGVISAQRRNGELKLGSKGGFTLGAIEIFIEGVKPKSASAGTLKSKKVKFSEAVSEVTINL